MTTALAESTSSAITTAPSFAVPTADLADFRTHAEARRSEVLYTLRVLSRLHSRIAEVGKMRALKEIASLHRHAMPGLSAVSLDRKYKAYLALGWRGIVRNLKGPSQQPDKFIQEVKRMAELNHRSIEEALEQLRERWQAGEEIPGYGTWIDYYDKKFPERPVPKTWPRGFYPAGFSVRNLRRYGPTKGGRVLFQRGVAASKGHFPSVKKDPSSLRALELITIDDFELDALCVFPGDQQHAPQVGRVAGLLAVDVATRRKLVWGLGQALLREEPQPDGTVKTVRTGITRVDVQHLIFQLFERYGLPDYTVTLLVENAAAAISPELELCLETLFDGRVKVRRTGLINQKTLTNGFCEKGGKPWEKGWIEATFAQLWNYLGAIKGYKGANQRLDKPAGLDDAIRYTKLLLGQGDRGLNLPPEAITQLRAPFLNQAELEAAFAWAVGLSEKRTKHNYIGFERITEFQIEEGQDPVSINELALLPPERQLQVTPIERSESSLERWGRLIRDAQIQTVPKAVLSLLLLTPIKAKYRNHAVTFTVSKEGYTYLDTAGDVLADYTDGTEFLVYFDRTNPDVVQLCDLKGNYLGELRRLGGRRGMVDIRDQAAIAEAAAMTKTVFNRAVAELRQRHAGADAQLAADRAHNDAVVAAHREATADMSKAERIAAAVGERRQEKVAIAKVDTAAIFARRAKAAAHMPSAAPDESANWV